MNLSAEEARCAWVVALMREHRDVLKETRQMLLDVQDIVEQSDDEERVQAALRALESARDPQD